MGSRKTNTEPMLPMSLARGGLGSDTVPDRVDGAAPDAPTDPGDPPVILDRERAEHAEHAEASKPESVQRVEDILKNMKPARVWSPKPAVHAESQGADFAAYHAVHDAAKKHLTPPPAAPVVVADVTPPASATGDLANNATVVDLGTAIERAQAHERAAMDAGNRAANRASPTVLVREPRARRRRLVVFLVATLAIVSVGLLGVLRVGGGRARPSISSAHATQTPGSVQPPASGSTAVRAAVQAMTPPSASADPAAPNVDTTGLAAASPPIAVRAAPSVRAPAASSRAATPATTTTAESGRSTPPAARPASSAAPTPEVRPPGPPATAPAIDHVRGI